MRDGIVGRAEEPFQRDLGSLRSISRFLRTFCTANGIAAEHVEPVILAAEELFTNMLKYGGGAGEIRIELARTESELSISLTDDDAEEFDPRKAPDVRVDQPLAERQPGGLGIHLVKKLMDRIEYTYENRRATTTCFKTLDG
jgi:serine/threonine-protein kinase RsbW